MCGSITSGFTWLPHFISIIIYELHVIAIVIMNRSTFSDERAQRGKGPGPEHVNSQDLNAGQTGPGFIAHHCSICLPVHHLPSVWQMHKSSKRRRTSARWPNCCLWETYFLFAGTECLLSKEERVTHSGSECSAHSDRRGMAQQVTAKQTRCREREFKKGPECDIVPVRHVPKSIFL